jgi:hypothetical protein
VPIRSDKALKQLFVQAGSEERVPGSLAGDHKLEQEIKKYLGSAPILYDENEKDFNQIVDLVREQLSPTNILEQNWVMDYAYSCYEMQRLRRFKQKLLYTAIEDSVARVISPFLDHNTLKVRLLARGWASRTPSALTEVDELLENAGLDREVVLAQILADKFDVIERIDSMIFRTEQRRNVALREIERWREASAERLAQAQAASASEEGRVLRSLPGGAQSDGGAQRDPDRTG